MILWLCHFAFFSVAFPYLYFWRRSRERSAYDEFLQRQDLVWLKTSWNESTVAVHIKAPSLEPGKRPRMTLLFSHGKDGEILKTEQLQLLTELGKRLDVDIFAYEYVGYGLSGLDGHAVSEASCFRSADAAWRHLVDHLRTPPRSVVIYGKSMGSGPAVDLASRGSVHGSAFSPLDVGGVLLEAPILSAGRVLGDNLARRAGWLVGDAFARSMAHLDIFANSEKVERIRAPLAVAHGAADVVVLPAHGRALHALARHPFEPFWPDGQGHRIRFKLRVEYIQKFVQSLQQASNGDQEANPA